MLLLLSIVLLEYLVLILCVLVSVAYVTLLERKVLGYVQMRKGPNKLGVLGLFQPFSDAIKLFSKENNLMLLYNMLLYYVVPMVSLFLMFLFWVIFPWSGVSFVSYDILLVLVVSSMGVYVLLGAGWSSNSKYALLGAYRGVAQTISYEVSFSFIILTLLLMSGAYEVSGLMVYNKIKFLGMLILLFMVWLITILAEVNRTPFDFSEGESELVSGFNVEYGAGGFAILFMAEYGNIIFMSFLSSYLFWGTVGVLSWFMMGLVIFILWVRGTLVRFRYDNLMMLAWKIILPFTIYMLVINLGVSVIIL